MRVLGIVGSYRRGGMVDQAVSQVLSGAAERGAQVEKIYLLDCCIEFCANCRSCTQQPGAERGTCVLEDEMAPLLEAMDENDVLVIGAPVHNGALNALTQRFLERLVCYGFWPWGADAPQLRRKGEAHGDLVLITTSAMPSLMARFFTHAMCTLTKVGGILGRKVRGRFYIGLAARQAPRLSPRMLRRLLTTGRRMAAP